MFRDDERAASDCEFMMDEEETTNLDGGFAGKATMFMRCHTSNTIVACKCNWVIIKDIE